MEILLGGGIVGCIFILYWSVAYPEMLIDAILLRDKSGMLISIIIISYIVVSVLCVVLGLQAVINES